MIYKRPKVENIPTYPSFMFPSEIKPNPLGPITIPAIISPIKEGMRKRFKITGESKIMNRSKENTKILFSRGSSNAS